MAIECEGQFYHVEKVPNEMARQAILEHEAIPERLGWSFIRIRASSFYRDPQGTMKWVCKKLISMGVEPIGTEVETSGVNGEPSI